MRGRSGGQLTGAVICCGPRFTRDARKEYISKTSETRFQQTIGGLSDFSVGERHGGSITELGGWVVIEPLRPLFRQGPRGLSHHVAINDRLMRSGGSLTFTG
jgi:hypothetical protein